MTLAYWMVLIAIFLPYIAAAAAKSGGKYDNSAPRAQLEKASGWRQRANWAQMNAFEAFPPFAAAVIIAHQLNAPQDRIDLLAVLFVGFRLLHLVLYILDRPTLRSLAWAGGFLCVIGLFVIAA
ncbi:MAPEG family protein [Thermithiobacillus plumbiphilus]|uniref:MAPEG family protein n=1 Tax=Thermithiobacillus plumbiphilus TaxID=1729899 RepID=A0ABU9D877_9PROT